MAPGVPGLVIALLLSLPGSVGTYVASSPLCLSFRLTLTRALMDEGSRRQSEDDRHISRSLITSAKALFPNKVTFTGSEYGDLISLGTVVQCPTVSQLGRRGLCVSNEFFMLEQF